MTHVTQSRLKMRPPMAKSNGSRRVPLLDLIFHPEQNTILKVADVRVIEAENAANQREALQVLYFGMTGSGYSVQCRYRLDTQQTS